MFIDNTARAAVLVILAAVPAGAAFAQQGSGEQVHWTKKREFAYFLPKTTVAANVGQRIISCPVLARDEPAVETAVSIVTKNGPDASAMVRIDGSSGFLAKRTTKLSLSPVGTLTAFNASTEGQGGEVVVAAIKTAATIASFAAGGSIGGLAGAAAMQPFEMSYNGSSPPALDPSGPAPSPVKCNAKTRDALAKLARIGSQIAELEQSIAKGEAGTAESELLALRREQQKKLHTKLTITSASPAVFNIESRPQTAAPMKKFIPAVDYSDWFENVSSDEGKAWLATIPGSSGFIAELAPDKGLFAALSGDGSVLDNSAQPYLFYRRPVPASVSVKPCLAGLPSGAACAPDLSPEGKQVSETKKVSIPQLSGTYAIPIGRGGIFGTVQASAKFDESGAPTELEYGSGSAGADMAKVLGAANEGIVTLRDAELAALKRLAEEATALKTIDAAREELQKEE